MSGREWGVYRTGIGLVSTAAGMTKEDAEDQRVKLQDFNGSHAKYYVDKMPRG